MQANFTPFVYGDHMVRSFLDEQGDPWFVAKDVCKVLEIGNNRDAISQLDDDEKITVANSDGNPRAGIPHQWTAISESGMYFLAFRSRKDEARAFSKWVRSEVLPALRKTGHYAMPSASASSTPGTGYAASRPISRCLRLPQRERALDRAVQVSRDRGVPSLADIERFYRAFCAIMAEGLDGEGRALEGEELSQSDRVDLIVQFLDECCTPANGKRVSAAEVYAAFRVWWPRHAESDVPSQKLLGTIMQERFAKIRRGGIYYYVNLVLDHPA